MDNPPWLSQSLVAINNLAWANEPLSDPAKTEHIYKQGLQLSRHLGRGRNAAEIENNLGRLRYSIGDLQGALDYLGRALTYFTSGAKDELWAAHIHQTRANVFLATGDKARAELELQQALNYRTADSDPVRRAESLLALTDISLARDDIAAAERQSEQALALLKEVDDHPKVSANAHQVSARIAVAKDKPNQAVSDLRWAKGIYSNLEDVRGQADTTLELAVIRARAGNTDESLKLVGEALELAASVDDRFLMFRTLSERSRILAAAGRWKRAKESAADALRRSEQLRHELAEPMLRRHFASIEHSTYDVLVYSALQSDSLTEALKIANVSKLRRYLETSGSGAFDRQLSSETDQRRYRSLVWRRSKLAEKRTALLSTERREENDRTENELAVLNGELSGIVSQIESLIQSTQSTEKSQHASIDLKSIQALLKPEQVILQYYFGDLISGVWKISAENIDFRQFAAPNKLKDTINDAVLALQQRQPIDKASLSGLTQGLLGDAEDWPFSKNQIVVIPDDSLYSLPFSILPDPKSLHGQLLLDSSEIRYATSLADLSLNPDDESTFSRIAIVADPVFSLADTRVSSLPKTPIAAVIEPGLLRSAERTGINIYDRLPGTADEANAIVEAAGSSEVFLATGIDANTNLVLSGKLRNYDILHFATHGILNADEPALSGLVLSGVDAHAKSQPRFLRAQDIALAPLDAKLVVLSGCETGLGTEVRGQGVLSLSQAFLDAGASKVVSTLWRIPDRATSVFMRYFYEELTGNKESAASALRKAKLKMRSQARWSDPYYWAGFVLHDNSLDKQPIRLDTL